jgi:N-acetyltransferase
MKTIIDFFKTPQPKFSLKRKADVLVEKASPNGTKRIDKSTTSPSESSALTTPTMTISPSSTQFVPATHEKKESCERKDRTPRKKEQTYLDFGQASFGSRRMCNYCNMMIVNGHPEDEGNHLKICNLYRLGVPFQMKLKHIPSNCVYKLERTKGQDEDFIVLIRASDALNLRKKVLDVNKIVEEELGFAHDDYTVSSPTKSSARRKNDTTFVPSDPFTRIFRNDRRIFMFVSNKRVVGYCSVQVVQHAFLLLSDDEKTQQKSNLSDADTRYHFTRSNQPTKAMMGVHQLWCHKSHRNKRIASKLLDVARRNLIYGIAVSKNMVAFSSPTIDGALFAKRYCGSNTPLVYDYC